MLASITPLGERSRGSRWEITIAWLIVGGIVGGALIGAALGALGEAFYAVVPVRPEDQAIAVGTVGILAGVTDLATRVTLPTTKRQVNAYWLGRYRGWVVGVGFGFQLGLGISTIVTTATVYATLLIATLAGSAINGAIVGGAFALARGLAALASRRVETTRDLMSVSRWLTDKGNVAARSAGVGAVLAGASVIAMSI